MTTAPVHVVEVRRVEMIGPSMAKLLAEWHSRDRNIESVRKMAPDGMRVRDTSQIRKLLCSNFHYCGMPRRKLNSGATTMMVIT